MVRVGWLMDCGCFFSGFVHNDRRDQEGSGRSACEVVATVVLAKECKNMKVAHGPGPRPTHLLAQSCQVNLVWDSEKGLSTIILV